jgi:hypothetical protein
MGATELKSPTVTTSSFMKKIRRRRKNNSPEDLVEFVKSQIRSFPQSYRVSLRRLLPLEALLGLSVCHDPYHTAEHFLVIHDARIDLTDHAPDCAIRCFQEYWLVGDFYGLPFRCIAEVDPDKIWR